MFGNETSSFWKNKKVLITGHTGFKGGWLSLMLHSKGAKVIGYSLAPATKPSLFKSLNLDKKVTSVFGDIRDLANLKKVIKKYKPEIIFHLAAQPLVKKSYQDPIETFETNVIGTANVLEAVRYTETVKVVVCITSDKCYENNEWSWPYREDDRLGGHDPYSASKACAELVISSFKNSYFLNSKKQRVFVASTRAGNVIGGGDWSKDRIIPDVIRAIYENKDFSLRNPNAVRPWQHVLEPLKGYVLLAEKLFKSGNKFSEAWNFGPNNTESVTVKKIIDQAVKVSGKKINLKKTNGVKPHEAGLLLLDSSKSKSNLGWAPKLNTNEAIRLTIEWFDAFYKKEKMDEFTLRQISKYEEK
jgi:CDP-glucose 4,6-dehydratase